MAHQRGALSESLIRYVTSLNGYIKSRIKSRERHNRAIAKAKVQVRSVRSQAEKSLGLGRSVIKFSNISKPYFFVFIRRKVHFITVTLQRCYKYDDREKDIRRYSDVVSEASVGEN